MFHMERRSGACLRWYASFPRTRKRAHSRRRKSAHSLPSVRGLPCCSGSESPSSTYILSFKGWGSTGNMERGVTRNAPEGRFAWNM